MADPLDLGPWAEWIRDPALVVEVPSLRIHGWNGSGRQLFGSGAGGATGPDEGSHLPSLMADDAEKMVNFTMLCAGSRQVLPGSVTLRQGDGVKRYQVEGRLIQPGSEDSPTLVGLRFKDPKEAHHRFRLLNDKIEELSKEIGAKQRTERFLDDVRTGFEKIALGAPLDETLTHLCRSVEGYAVAGTTASVLLLDRRSGRLRHVGESSLPEEYARAIDGVRIGPAVGSCGTAAYLNEEVVVTDIASDPLWADFKDVALTHGLRACWSTPIPSTDGTVLGTFAFYSDTPRGPTRREIRIAGIASRTAAIAIQRDGEQARARRLLQRERRSREEAEGANRAKDEFLAVVSHELRNPLSAILGWARLLSDDGLDEETRRRGVEAIERNAENQSQLISDVLDYSRASAGSLSLEPTPIPLRELVRKVVDSLTPVAHGAGVELEYHAPPSAPPVLCDRERIYQVLYNLVSNSIKFTPEGGCITIELDQNDELATVRVTDSGEGIDPAFLPFVFERFRQADSSKTRPHAGLGLGLAVVKSLVELHGGTVDASSLGVGEGSTFTVRLPVNHGPGFQYPHAEPVHADVDISGVHVLVVDDEPDAREIFEAVLRRGGAIVTSAASASEALEKLEAEKPTVLLSDIAMPGVDGLALIQAIRSRFDWAANIPAGALSAHAREIDRESALGRGYDLHLAKPVEPTELIRAVDRLARRGIRIEDEVAG